jgi:hypothetical protein
VDLTAESCVESLADSMEHMCLNEAADLSQYDELTQDEGNDADVPTDDDEGYVSEVIVDWNELVNLAKQEVEAEHPVTCHMDCHEVKDCDDVHDCHKDCHDDDDDDDDDCHEEKSCHKDDPQVEA